MAEADQILHSRHLQAATSCTLWHAFRDPPLLLLSCSDDIVSLEGHFDHRVQPDLPCPLSLLAGAGAGEPAVNMVSLLGHGITVYSLITPPYSNCLRAQVPGSLQ